MATEIAPIKHALDLCGGAVNAEIKVNNLQRQIIADEELRFKDAEKIITQDTAWYRSPLLLFTLGVLAGSVGVVYAQRHL